MRILVVGSKDFAEKEDKLSGDELKKFNEQYISASKELGKTLALNGHTIIVGNDDPKNMELYAVDGANSAVNKQKPAVLVVYSGQNARENGVPFAGKNKEEHAQKDFEYINFEYKVIRGPWAAVRVSQIQEADGVIALGGSSDGGTEQIGFAAPELETPVLAIPSFGGASKKISAYLESYYRGLLTEKGIVSFEAWNDDSAQNAVNAIEKLIDHNPHRLYTFSQFFQMSVLLIILIFLWVSLLAKPQFLADIFTNSVFVFFLLLGISAVLGTGLRTVMQRGKSATSKYFWRQFMRDVVLGLLLAFAFSLIYLIGGYTVTGEIILSSSNELAPEDFTRIAITISLLGFSVAFLTESATKRLRQRFETIISDEKAD